MNEIKAKAREIHALTVTEVRSGQMSVDMGRKVLRAAEAIIAAVASRKGEW